MSIIELVGITLWSMVILMAGFYLYILSLVKKDKMQKLLQLKKYIVIILMVEYQNIK